MMMLVMMLLTVHFRFQAAETPRLGLILSYHPKTYPGLLFLHDPRVPTLQYPSPRSFIPLQRLEREIRNVIQTRYEISHPPLTTILSLSCMQIGRKKICNLLLWYVLETSIVQQGSRQASILRYIIRR